MTQLVERVTPDWLGCVLSFAIAGKTESVVVVDYQTALDSSELRTFSPKKWHISLLERFSLKGPDTRPTPELML